MFQRRRKNSAPARPNAPSQSAALAAAQAFARPPTSDGSLSASAAAAALRSHTPPPTNPAHFHTKRMIRRGSTSSRGSDFGSTGRPGLQRVNSNGSMTDRSFRSPSPGRPAPAVRADPNAPPVPALPSTLSSTTGSQRRSSSMEPQARIASPPPRRAGGRGMSVDTSHRSQQSQPGTGKRDSVNFSRPMSPPLSPQNASPSSPRSGRTGWFTAPVGSDVKLRQDVNTLSRPTTAPNSHATHQAQQNVQSAADAPVYRHKNVGNALPAQGSRLSQAVSGMNSSKYAVKFDPHTRTIQRVATGPEPGSEPESQGTSRLSTWAAQGSSPTIAQPAASTSLAAEMEKELSFSITQGNAPSNRASGLLGKQPSVVRENREEEEKYEEPPWRNPARVASPTRDLPVTPKAPAGHLRSSSLQPEDALQNRGGHSRSSSRQAHFEDFAIVTHNNTRHDPPPRSVSPAKPALKQSPASSVRATSPIVRTKTISRDASVSGSEDGRRSTGKKAVRVSFGSESQMIPPAASTGLDSSKYASSDPWDENSVYEMSPRPNLPSFGSVRGRDRPDHEVEPTAQATGTASPSLPRLVSTLPSPDTSSDQALGNLHKDTNGSANPKPIAEPGKEFGSMNEPVAPEVTTVEGTGNNFDSESSEDEKPAQREEPILSISESHTPRTESAPLTEASNEMGALIPSTTATGTDSSYDNLSNTVPDIAVQPATPGAYEGDLLDELAVDMPGSFSENWTEGEGRDEGRDAISPSQETTVTGASATQPSVKLPPTDPADHLPQHVPETIHEEESDNDSIYSDAEEELDDVDQFASIDAVVKSPMPESPVVEPSTPVVNLPHVSPPSNKVEDVSSDSPDWKETKAYWTSLTRQQRAELEQEAERNRAAQVPAVIPAQPKRKTKVPSPPPVETYQNSPQPRRNAQSGGQQATVPARTRQKGDAGPPSPKEEVHLRKSMRESMRDPPANAQPTGSHMRQSMRGAPGRSSMRESQASAARSPTRLAQPAPDPRQVQQKRPTQTQASPQPRTAAQQSSVASRPSAAPPLSRRDSSGSDSSFRRMRPASIMSDGGRYSMKRSMRGSGDTGYPEAPRSLRAVSPPARPRTANDGSSMRFSLRSLSPPRRRAHRSQLSIDSTVSQRPQSAAPTMRDSSLRASKSPTRFSMFGRNTEAGARGPASETSKTSRPAFKSRLSIDSDAGSPVLRSRFTSRFADSDDEDESPVALQQLTPVRGIPRRIGEEDRDSTDLDDESADEARRPPVAKPSVGPANNGKAVGSALGSGSMRGLESSKYAVPVTNGTANVEQSPHSPQSPRKEKRQFFNIGNWRKRSGSVSSVQPGVPGIKTTPATVPPTQEAAKTSSPIQARGKLQRRSTRESIPRTNSGMWELPPPPKIRHFMAEDEDRPTTSGVTEASSNDRPDMGNRRSTVDGSTGLNVPRQRELRFDEGSIVGAPAGQGSSVGRKATTGKKKKFGLLRRAFQLND